MAWLGLAHALCSVQACHILFLILLHVCMSVDFASVKVVIKESYYYYYYTSIIRVNTRFNSNSTSIYGSRCKTSLYNKNYNPLTSCTDLSPIPVRSTIKSYLTSWCIQNLSKRALNRLTVSTSTTKLGWLFQMLTIQAEEERFFVNHSETSGKLICIYYSLVLDSG